jgi:hypothetical protein
MRPYQLAKQTTNTHNTLSSSVPAAHLSSVNAKQTNNPTHQRSASEAMIKQKRHTTHNTHPPKQLVGM